MNPSSTGSLLQGLLLGGGIITLLLQTITLIGLVWKGGRWSQRIESEQKSQDELFDRIVKQMDQLEARVGSLEGRKT